MKIKIFTTILISVFFNLILFAGEVSIDKARQVAKNLYFQKSDVNYNGIIFDKDFTIYEGNTPVYYVFNISNENGFIIVSAEDHVLPILGYSFEGNYYENNQPAQFISWMQNYKEQILFVKENNLPVSSEIISLWEKYEKRIEKDNGFYENRVIVGPLLGDIKWDQGCLYNDSCPPDAAGPCGHAYAGCVATATGMIMKYHSHPHQGVGSHSYTHSIYGTLSANFGATTYDWANMPVSGSNGNVAQLLYHVGVSIDMNYGPSSSSGYTSAAVTALKTYFEYKPSAFYDQKVYYSDPVWNNMLITELDNDRPLLYRGSGTGGHAFVCDGYDDDYQSTGALYFHFNWGWSRTYNGYYQLINLNPGSHNYTNDQAAGFGIEPKTSVVPYSDFSSDGNCPCIGNTVNFLDQSTNGPNSWSWTFPSGAPASSTNEDPSITYNTAGNYDVTLTASNVSGAGNTQTRINYINVYNSPTAPSCLPYTQTLGNYWYGILNVTINNLDHSTGDAYSDGGCMDFTCRYSTTLTPGTTYPMEITVRVGTSGNAHTNAYIDFNNDGDFDDTGECIINDQISSNASSANTFTSSIVMPSNPTINQLLRMRVISDYTTISGPCSDPYIGQSEDYGVFFEAVPPAPNATAATNILQTSFDANWDASSGADGYYLDVATDNGFTNFVTGYNNLNVGNVTTYNVTSLSANTDYYYRVRAFNSYGTSSNSNVISLTTLPNAPSAPNATAATNITQTSFDANWDASTGADGYYLDVATDNGFTSFVSGYDNLNVGNVTTYNVSGLTANTDYYYRVSAYNTGGTSSNSNVISLTTLPDPPPVPNATIATNIQQTSFDANWDASTGADGYYLDVATDNAFTSFVSGYDNFNVGNVTTYNVSGLNSNTDYFYRIRAYNAGGTSGNSNVINLTTLKYPPDPPVANAATNISQTAFDANWSTSTGADGYYLDVATDNGFTNFVSGYNNLQVSDTTYFVSGLSPETEYFYRVRAYNNGGTSGNSNVISVTTLPNNPGAPVATAATNITQTSFDANWDPASGASFYWLDVATDNGFTSFVSGFENLNVGNVTTYPVTGLNPGTDYFYRLRAENASGTSGNSNVINLTTLPDIPLPPNALPASIITHTTFYANWDPSLTADSYYLDVATDNGFTGFVSGFENLNVGNVTTYYVIGLSQGTEYFYRLRAENSAGTSGNSNVINLTTLYTGVDDLKNTPIVKIFSIKNNIYINIKGLEKIEGQVNIYNINGEPVISKNLENSTINSIPVNVANSVYIVKIILNNRIYTKKIFVFGM